FRLVMSSKKQKRKSTVDGKSTTKPPIVEVSEEYGAGTGTNALIIEPAAKKQKTDKKTVEKPPERKNIVREKREAKVSKTKLKKLKQIAEKKKKKETQEDLLAQLSQYRLDDKKLEVLASTAHRQDKVKKSRVTEEVDVSVVQRPHKVKLRRTLHNKAAVQENYYSTDSGSDEDEEEEENEVEEVTEVKTEDEVGGEKHDDALQDVFDSEEVKEDKEEEKGEEVKKTSEYKRIDRPEDEDPDVQIPHVPAPTVSSGWKRIPVVVNRPEKIQESRQNLPIFGEEQTIVEAINENVSVVVCGETGSGKTTQIPQMLYEAGYCTDGKLIGVTEPRRVAAVSMARRVGEEVGDTQAVSYQIRYEGTKNENTKILFMTDGVLMKEMSTDISLSKYSVIIIDEAHERSLYSDVLIGLLSRVAPMRAKTQIPLKLVIMSATLRLDDFLQRRLFPSGPPRVLKAEARQFPVTIHFDRKTPKDFMVAAFRKTSRIHESLPEGGILIFVPGQRDVQLLIKKLQERYPVKYEQMRDGETVVRGGKKWMKKKEEEVATATLEELARRGSAPSRSGVKEEGEEETGRDGDEEGADAWDGDDSDDEGEGGDDELAPLAPPPADCQPLFCLPLYSLLSSAQQRRVFDPPPEGTRLCVIATNVAETSLTIPGVKYVLDSGFEKRRLFDPVTGVSQFVVARVSQASADQRAGRAGRVGPGHAYRMYSSAVFSEFSKFSRPEIMDKPADQLVLQLKSMNIIKVVNFPFPSTPPTDSLEEAEKRLVLMGALDVGKSAKTGELQSRISTLGRTLVTFPLSPSYAKMLALAHQQNLLPFAIQLVAVLSVREPMVAVASLRGSSDEETKAMMTTVLRQRRSWVGKGPSRRLGDLLVLMKAVTESEKVQLDPVECGKLGIRAKAMHEVRKLRVQLTNVVNTSFSSQTDAVCDQQLRPPNDKEALLLRQAVCCGLSDRIARRVDRSMIGGNEEIPKGAYQTQTLEDYVYIDASSMLYKEEPDWVVFQEIMQINDKKCMQSVSAVEGEWLMRLAEPYCHYGEAEKDVEPIFDKVLDAVVESVSVSFGPHRWPLPNTLRPIQMNILMYKHFARLLLAGEVIPTLAQWTSSLLAPPSTMLKSWAKLQKRTDLLLNALIEKDVHSRSRLLDIWKDDKSYLLDEYSSWLPEKLHDTVQVAWPPEEN
ncbi:rha-2, partial [Pristionchus pacificus]